MTLRVDLSLIAQALNSGFIRFRFSRDYSLAAFSRLIHHESIIAHKRIHVNTRLEFFSFTQTQHLDPRYQSEPPSINGGVQT